MSAGWDSARGGTVIARHEYKGRLKMPGALEDLVEKRWREATDLDVRRSARLRAQHEQSIPGAYEGLDDFGEGDF